MFDTLHTSLGMWGLEFGGSTVLLYVRTYRIRNNTGRKSAQAQRPNKVFELRSFFMKFEMKKKKRVFFYLSFKYMASIGLGH